MNIALREHEKIARIVAKELENEGYAVVFEPSPNQLPFSLEDYTPDLLATKTGENLIVEVKPRRTPDIVKRYRKVAEIVQTHPGWRFLIKTFADTTWKTEALPVELTSLQEIRQYIAKAESTFSSENFDLAIPYLWNAIIALLRHKAARVQIDFSELSDRSLINQLYTFGKISAEQRIMLLKWSELRNRAVHDLKFSAEQEDVSAISAFANELVAEVTNYI